jgi:alkaline phosphatase D
MALQLGPIVGEVTPSSAKIWFRADVDGTYACHVFTDPMAPTEVPGSPWQAVIAQPTGHTATVQVALPNADQLYYYDIRGPGGSTILPGGRLPFKNAPASGTPSSLTFAFVSCHKPFEYPEAQRFLMWDQMSSVFPAQNVRFLLMIGDQVYGDDCYGKVSRGEQPAVEAYREVYQQFWGHESVMRILGRYPTYMIWDDHEIRDGWGSKGGDSNTDPIFQAARQVYHEFQHRHNPTSFGPEAQHYAFQFGQFGFLVLDLRGHRNLSRNMDERPLLGTKQWSDITEWLTTRARNYRVLFIVCSVPIVHVPPGAADWAFWSDHWSSMKIRPEQEALVRLLFKVMNETDNLRQVVVLGGNVHEGTMAMIRSHLPAHNSRPRIYQFTSSPIANEPAPIANWAIRTFGSRVKIDDNDEIVGEVLEEFPKRNFGLVHVNYDSGADTYRVVFELYQEGKSPYTFST